MRRTAFVITLCMLLTAGSAPAADDLVSSAMKLYENGITPRQQPCSGRSCPPSSRPSGAART